ncbi:hypothetical protein GCM10010964_23660 [Caldovatus sediminis]|uniref:Uncharacterized protein n=1 Tax=Caldovatus sediminis TaxID=2041189 RepID=A0A8J2ZBF5_9PROT|nr:hypothetical protein GCM10010964_23660 [Caldovatus sediminis]
MSEMRSATLSGWPSETDSEVKRNSPLSRMASVVPVVAGERAAPRCAPAGRGAGRIAGGQGGVKAARGGPAPARRRRLPDPGRYPPFTPCVFT